MPNVITSVDIVSALGHAADSLIARPIVQNTLADTGMGGDAPTVRNAQAYAEESTVADGIKIACGQITWRRSEFSLEQILQQIAEAGYDGAPASAPSLDEVAAVRQKFDAAGLSPAPAYLGAEFWDASQADEIVQKADRIAAISKAFDLTEVYVAANLTPERRAVSGHVKPSDALASDAWDVFAQTLNRKWTHRGHLPNRCRAAAHRRRNRGPIVSGGRTTRREGPG